MDKVVAEVLSAFSIETLIEELRDRGDHTDTYLLSVIEDQELIDEVYDRDLSERFEIELDISDALDSASDQQIIDEYEHRHLHHEREYDGAHVIYELISSGQPYDDEVREFICEVTGRIL